MAQEGPKVSLHYYPHDINDLILGEDRNHPSAGMLGSIICIIVFDPLILAIIYQLSSHYLGQLATPFPPFARQ